MHEAQYASILKFIEPGMTILDAGCGEGTLSILMARKGARVTGCDISKPNVTQCNMRAKEQNVEVDFCVGDAEDLPFDNDSFDLVVSSHVLEHLPNFDTGLREAMRVTKKRAIIAIPTLPNMCSVVQIGQGWFYLQGPRSFLAFFVGLGKMLLAFLLRKEGVDETYAGTGAPHVFRFPWVMKSKIKKHNFKLIAYEASSVCLPYFEFLLPLIKFLDRYADKFFIRNLGYGTTFVIEKTGT